MSNDKSLLSPLASEDVDLFWTSSNQQFLSQSKTIKKKRRDAMVATKMMNKLQKRRRNIQRKRIRTIICFIQRTIQNKHKAQSNNRSTGVQLNIRIRLQGCTRVQPKEQMKNVTENTTHQPNKHHKGVKKNDGDPCGEQKRINQ